jgi:hypothetical protein
MCDYWITRDYLSRTIHVNFIDRRYQNLNAFLNMARRSCLREAVAALREAPEAPYSRSPGEYLELTAENGIVEAAITLFEDTIPVRMPVGIFCRIVTEYLEEVDTMCRALGLM